MLGGRYGWVPPPKGIEREFLNRVLAGNTPAGELGEEQQEVFRQLYSIGDEAERRHLREKPHGKEEMRAWNKLCSLAVQILQVAGLPETERFALLRTGSPSGVPPNVRPGSRKRVDT